MSETKKETNTEQPQTETVEEKQPQAESVEKTEAVENTQTKTPTKTGVKKPTITRVEGTLTQVVKTSGKTEWQSKPLLKTKTKTGTRIDY